MTRFIIVSFSIIIMGMLISATVYQIQADKELTSMMKACAESHGNWSLNWRNQPQCLRGTNP